MQRPGEGLTREGDGEVAGCATPSAACHAGASVGARASLPCSQRGWPGGKPWALEGGLGRAATRGRPGGGAGVRRDAVGREQGERR